MGAGRIRLVVLFGGQSAEHEVSLVTARHVVAAADPGRYELVPLAVRPDGTWVLAEAVAAALAAGRELPAAFSAEGPEVEPFAAISADAGQEVVVLPLLHGPLGEDGTVQGLLELADVAYVGSGVLASALAMDKAKAKEVAAWHGLPQVRWLTVHASQATEDPEQVRLSARELGLPLFVKPCNMGSSVGVTKVTDPEALLPALDSAFEHDEWALVEEGVEGREIEVAVLGNLEPRASLPGEIVPAAEFYDYSDKYRDGAADLRVPAPLEPAAADEVRRLALDAYRAMRCEGLARVDFFFEEGRRGFLLNEVNTIPGFTPISMYPKLWEATGLPYTALIDELVDLARERHARRGARRRRA